MVVRVVSLASGRRKWGLARIGTTWRSCRSIKTTSLSQVEINKHDDNDSSIADLLRPHYENQTPVILRNYAREWPALSQWTKWDYLKSRVGDDWPCDVEMGSYNNHERLTIPFASYMDYLTLYREQQQEMEQGNDDNESSPILYLAQNDIPQGLYDDIVLPPFLNTSTAKNIGKVVSVHVVDGSTPGRVTLTFRSSRQYSGPSGRTKTSSAAG
eukprot:scaffold609_cov170-Amphora_coffeaeformis.AAC.59